ncbi:MAG: polysaccharide pyruvyl transferase family protein [Massilia sp.]
MKRKIADLLVRACAPAIVEDAYAGVLARAADPDGLAVYSAALRDGAGLPQLLAALTGSDEQWEQALAMRANALTDAVFQGLLGRAPEVADPVMLAPALHALQSLVADVAASTERWQRSIAEHAGELVRAAFLGLLEREPEPAALAQYTATLQDMPGLTALLAEIGNSTEHWEKSLRKDAARNEAFWRQGFAARADGLARAIQTGMFGSGADVQSRQAQQMLLEQGPDGLAEAIRLVSHSPASWEHSLARHSAELVQAAHTALLDQQCDAEMVAQHSAALRSTDSLAALLADLGRSPAMLNRQMALHADAFVAMVFEGVLARAPDALEQARWRDHGGSMAGLLALLQALGSGDECRARQFAHDEGDGSLPMRLADALYRGLLDRPADPEGQRVLARRIRDAGDVAAAAATLRASREFKQAWRAAHAQAAAPEGSWHPVVARIEAMYLRHLRRAVSATELAQHISAATPPWALQQALIAEARASAPTGQGPLRVLLFGAYGNGNMGDAYQALAVRSHLLALFGERPVEIHATSVLCSSTFVYPAASILPAEAIYDFDLVNSFDYLIIGGGGLLAHPHDPLDDVQWCRRIHTPIILLAIGASGPEVARHHTLLQQALYVIGRDATSVAALVAVRPDALLAADPILCLPGVAPLLSAPAAAAGAPTIDVLWVLKYPASAADAALLRQIRSHILASRGQRHLVVGIEPALDGVLLEQFAEFAVVLTENLDELAALMQQAKQVFSMRYHGAIFALLIDRPALLASQSKLRDLARSLATPAAFLESAAEIDGQMWSRALQPDSVQFNAIKAGFSTMLTQLEWSI